MSREYVTTKERGDQEDVQNLIEVVSAFEDIRQAASKGFGWLSRYKAANAVQPREPLCCVDYQEIHCLMYPDSFDMAEESVLVAVMFANIGCHFTLPAGTLIELSHKVAEIISAYQHLSKAREILSKSTTANEIKTIEDYLPTTIFSKNFEKKLIKDTLSRENVLKEVSDQLSRYEHALNCLRMLLSHKMFIPISEIVASEPEKETTNELFVLIYDSLNNIRPGRTVPNIADSYNLTKLMQLIHSGKEKQQSRWYPYLLSHTGTLMKAATFKHIVIPGTTFSKTHEFILEPLVQWILDFARRQHDNIDDQLNYINNTIISVTEELLKNTRARISGYAKDDILYSTFANSRLPATSGLPIALGIAYDKYYQLVHEPLMVELEKAYETARTRGFSVSQLVKLSSTKAITDTSSSIPRVTWTGGEIIAGYRKDLSFLLTQIDTNDSLELWAKNASDLLMKTEPREKTNSQHKKVTYEIVTSNEDLIFATQFFDHKYFSAYWPALLSPLLVISEIKQFLKVIAQIYLPEGSDNDENIFESLSCQLMLMYDCCIVIETCKTIELEEKVPQIQLQHSRQDEKEHNHMLRHIRVETKLADIIADIVLKDSMQQQFFAVIATRDVSKGIRRLFHNTAREFHYADLIAERFGQKFAAHIEKYNRGE